MSSLLDKVEVASKKIECHVTGWYSSSCDDWKAQVTGWYSSKATPFDSEWSTSPTLLSEVRRAFGDLPGAEWKSIESSYLSVFANMARGLLFTTEDAKQNGMNSGKRAAEKFNELKSCYWFDDFSVGPKLLLRISHNPRTISKLEFRSRVSL